MTGANAVFFDACAKGHVDAVRGLLADNPDLVRATNAAAPRSGWTGLHSAAQHGHLNLVRFLLGHGADPNAREAGDHTYPLHWAAAHRHVDVVRALLDAGGDVHGTGDDHELDVIGWATFFHNPGEELGSSPEVASLLAERGARHHIFSDRLLKSRQIEAAATGTADGIDFIEPINNTFYGARQFGIRDLNGYILYFIHQEEVATENPSSALALCQRSVDSFVTVEL